MDAETKPLDRPFILAVSLDEDSAEPLHQHIAEPVQTILLDNRLPPEQLFKDDIDMSQHLDTSRSTARREFNNLTNPGLLIKEQGASTRVTLPPIYRKVGLTSLFEDLKNAGLSPETEILEYKVKLADADIADLLECEEGTEVVHLKRLRYSRSYPLAILNNILVASKIPCPPQLSNSGLYECLKSMGSTPESAFQSVGAKRASMEEAELLQIDEGSAVISVERTVYSATGEVLNVEKDIYDASQYLLTCSLDSK